MKKSAYGIVSTLIVMLITGALGVTLAQDNLTDDEILKLYEGLRVADVSDGMDMVGLRERIKKLKPCGKMLVICRTLRRALP